YREHTGWRSGEAICEETRRRSTLRPTADDTQANSGRGPRRGRRPLPRDDRASGRVARARGHAVLPPVRRRPRGAPVRERRRRLTACAANRDGVAAPARRAPGGGALGGAAEPAVVAPAANESAAAPAAPRHARRLLGRMALRRELAARLEPLRDVRRLRCRR